MEYNRILDWEGCSNARDLGGMQAENGQRIRWGAAVRSDHPNKLTPQGWEALYAHGIRTIISLETDGMEDEAVVLPAEYADVNLVTAAIEDLSDKDFLTTWAASDLWCTPLYYQDAISRWPARHAAVFSAIAQAQAGGVLFHCARGHDRTGIIALMLLDLLGTPHAEIVSDYLISADPERDEILRQRNTTSEAVILNTLKDLEIEAYLLDAGLARSDLEKIKARLLVPGQDTH